MPHRNQYSGKNNVESTVRRRRKGGLSLTKADIIDVIATATGLTKVETEAVVDGFISTVINALKEGKSIEIRGFGSFKVKKRKGRVARNPRTGDRVLVDEHFVPYFKVSKELKNSVNANLSAAMPSAPPPLDQLKTEELGGEKGAAQDNQRKLDSTE